MSKIGRKPIPVSSAKIEVKGEKISISGSKVRLEHVLPAGFEAKMGPKGLVITTKNNVRITRMNWGLHRALLANKIKGVETGFEQAVNIVGLGFKAQLSGKKMVFSLGYSHKIDYDLPEGVTVEIDKTGQQLLFKSHDKFLLGNVCDDVKRFRPTEPYKGTGIMRAEEVIIRKAGKTGA